MTRETRSNLIFLAIILAILTPGAVILFRKKLQPTLKPMAMPEAVQRELAYISPLETPPGRKRVEPPFTAKWIESIVRERIFNGADAGGREVIRPVDRDGLPLMSDKRTFQLVAVEPLESRMRLWVILWDGEPMRDETWSVKLADAQEKFQIVDTRSVEIPAIVREELGETGVMRPPHDIVWQELVVPRAADGAVRLERGSGRTPDFVNFVPSFTNSGATRH
ncbi:MAG: hypothetical protein QOF78_2767 [Phycisphaerales bacterium]|jgi:hypothetical protein|nr:hypothetical protein [Phycisphaerales bacterium]